MRTNIVCVKIDVLRFVDGTEHLSRDRRRRADQKRAIGAGHVVELRAGRRRPVAFAADGRARKPGR